jgi:putative peptidoglycan lipid II flippase
VLSGAVRVVSGVTLLSRFGGLAREVLVNRVFGDTAIGSAFAAGFAVPNMFRRLLGEGALSAAFIPEYAQATKSDPGLAARFASLTVLSLALAATLLTVIIELGLLIALLLPQTPESVLSYQLIMLMLPFMPLICIAATLAGMLQVHGRFGPASTGPLILNGFIVAVGLYFFFTAQVGDQRIAYLLGTATVLSGFTQCLWFLRLLRPYIRWTRDFTGSRPGVERMLKRFLPVLVGMGTLQLNAFMDMLLAMWPIWIGPTILGHAYPLDEKSNILMAAAQRLYQFPLGVFGIAVATAIFPLLSRYADEPDHFLQTLRRGVRLSLFIGLPASLGVFLVRNEVITVLYGGRAGFSVASLARSADVLGGFATGIWAYSLNHVFTRAFYARGDTRTPMRIAVAMVILNLTLNWILMWPLREAGLAWSTSICAAIQTLVLGAFLGHQLHAPLLDAGTRAGLLKTTACAILMFARSGPRRSQRAHPSPGRATS